MVVMCVRCDACVCIDVCACNVMRVYVMYVGVYVVCV